MIILPKEVEKVSTFPQFNQGGFVTLFQKIGMNSELLGIKKVLSKTQLPPASEETDGKLNIVGYTNPFAEDTISFLTVVRQMAEQAALLFLETICQQHSNVICKREAILCGADPASIVAIAQEYSDKVTEITAGVSELTQENTDQMKSALGELLFRDDVKTCYDENQSAETVQRLVAEAQALGIAELLCVLCWRPFSCGGNNLKKHFPKLFQNKWEDRTFRNKQIFWHFLHPSFLPKRGIFFPQTLWYSIQKGYSSFTFSMIDF